MSSSNITRAQGVNPLAGCNEIAVLEVNYVISNTTVLEMPYFTTKPVVVFLNEMW